MGGGSGANQFRQELGEEGMKQPLQGIAPALAGNDRLAIAGEFRRVEIFVQAAGAMPKHGFHAVLGVFKVDPVVPEMPPQLGR